MTDNVVTNYFFKSIAFFVLIYYLSHSIVEFTYKIFSTYITLKLYFQALLPKKMYLHFLKITKKFKNIICLQIAQKKYFRKCYHD